jgi:hypothetical protein
MAAQFRKRWFWSITAANVAVCALLIGFIYLILAALAAFAAGVTTWPIYLLFGTGVVLAIVSWPLTRSAPRQRIRWLGYSLNGVPALIYLAVLVVGTSIWLSSTRRLFLIPVGFQGDLYVVHSPHRLQNAHKSYLRTTYLFSSDGVLKTDDPEPTTFSDEYAYLYPDGHRQTLRDAGPGTLPDTPENRANTKEVVTYFPRSLTAQGPDDCPMEAISIGTRAFLLSRRVEGATPDKTHPGICH